MFAFVCCTPYQIFNTLNFVINDIDGAKENSDIFICHGYRGMDKISDNIKKTGVFDQVYDVAEYRVPDVWYSPLIVLKWLLFPYRTINSHLLTQKVIRARAYEKMVISVASFFSMNLHDYCKIKETYLIEDGMLSYTVSDLQGVYMSDKFKLFNRLFHRGPLSFQVKNLYLNNVNLYKNKKYNAMQLPLMSNNNFLYTAEEVFDYKMNDQYASKRFVYLTQPVRQQGQIVDKQEEKILDCMKKRNLKDQTIIRLHPDQTKDMYKEWDMDEVENMWELECIHQIEDHHVLIACFSTAQITPKILKDKEPYIIFLYRLFGTEFVRGGKTRSFPRSLKNIGTPQRFLYQKIFTNLAISWKICCLSNRYYYSTTSFKT